MAEEAQSRFTCPRCGGHTFGSELAPVTFAIVARHCNGYMADGQSCKFIWKEEDDGKYGLLPPNKTETMVGTTLFEHIAFGDGVMTMDSAIQEAMRLPTEELMKKHDVDACKTDECLLCGIILCPKKEPLHLHHDGCPACD